jgi:ribulose-phosphate 3-epimerase
MKLYPTILTNSLEIFQKQINLLQVLEKIDTVQVDIVDGYFADNVTMTPLDLADVDFEDLKIDFHLMVNEPMDYVMEIEEVIDRLKIRAIIAHIERMTFQQDYVKEVKRLGKKVGVSLDLYTPLSAIDVDIWPELNIVQLLGVKAGFQGQLFQDVVLDKIKQLCQLIKEKSNKKVEIIVDGGVKLDNAAKIIQAGAESLAVGSQLWQATDLAKVVSKFYSL